MTIRDLDEKLMSKFRAQAARHGRSIEEEARDILRAALSVDPARTGGLADALFARASPRWAE
jgi:plasmid stability protein